MHVIRLATARVTSPACFARVSSSTAVYEVILTTALVTGLDDGGYACALVQKLRAHRLTG